MTRDEHRKLTSESWIYSSRKTKEDPAIWCLTVLCKSFMQKWSNAPYQRYKLTGWGQSWNRRESNAEATHTHTHTHTHTETAIMMWERRNSLVACTMKNQLLLMATYHKVLVRESDVCGVHASPPAAGQQRRHQCLWRAPASTLSYPLEDSKHFQTLVHCTKQINHRLTGPP